MAARAARYGRVVEVDALLHRGGARNPLLGVAAGANSPVPSPAAAAALPPPACAEVHMGLDLRALPVGTTEEGIRLFVGAQASEFQRKAPPGGPIELRFWPGGATFLAVFEGASQNEVMARCAKTVTRYLADAPHLPVTHERGAQVIEPCRRCQ